MGRRLVVALAATSAWRERMYAAPSANVAKRSDRSVAVSPTGQVELMDTTILQETWELEVTQNSLDLMLANPDTTLAVLQEAFSGELLIEPGKVSIQTTPAIEKTAPMVEIQMSFAEAADRAESWKRHEASRQESGLRHEREPVAVLEQYPPNFPTPSREVAGCHCEWTSTDGGQCVADEMGLLSSMGVKVGVTSPSALGSGHAQRAFEQRFVAAEALCQSIGKGQAAKPSPGDCAQCSGRSQCFEAWSLAKNEQISAKGVIGACSKDNPENEHTCSRACLDAFGCSLQACEGQELETRVGDRATRTNFADRSQVAELLRQTARTGDAGDMEMALACRPHFERASLLDRAVPAHECRSWVDSAFSVFMEGHSAVHMHEEPANPTLKIEFDIQIATADEPVIADRLAKFDIDATIDRFEKEMREQGVAIDDAIGFKEVTRGGTGDEPVEAIESDDDKDADGDDSTAPPADEPNDASSAASPSVEKDGGTLQVVLISVVSLMVIGTAYGVWKMHKAKDDDGEFEEEEEEYEEE